MLVKEELKKLGLHFIVDIGVADIMENITLDQLGELKIVLLRSGLEIVDDQRTVLVERVKNIIIEMIHYSDEWPRISLSDYLTGKLNHDFTYLSNLFYDIQGVTIEKFTIANKIERIKELIIYDRLSLKEIAWKMHYKSVSQLSVQFKMITGLSPGNYKNLKTNRQSQAEEIIIS
jgi:AraC-like DNA-binding protein